MSIAENIIPELELTDEREISLGMRVRNTDLMPEEGGKPMVVTGYADPDKTDPNIEPVVNANPYHLDDEGQIVIELEGGGSTAARLMIPEAGVDPLSLDEIAEAVRRGLPDWLGQSKDDMIDTIKKELAVQATREPVKIRQDEIGQ
jgi:hypothetical protein